MWRRQTSIGSQPTCDRWADTGAGVDDTHGVTASGSVGVEGLCNCASADVSSIFLIMSAPDATGALPRFFLFTWR